MFYLIYYKIKFLVYFITITIINLNLFKIFLLLLNYQTKYQMISNYLNYIINLIINKLCHFYLSKILLFF